MMFRHLLLSLRSRLCALAESKQIGTERLVTTPGKHSWNAASEAPRPTLATALEISRSDCGPMRSTGSSVRL